MIEKHHFFHVKTAMMFVITLFIVFVITLLIGQGSSILRSLMIVSIGFVFLFGFNYSLELTTSYLKATFRFTGIKLYAKKISINQITDCSLEVVRPLRDWGGWGYRMGKKGRGFIFPTSDSALVIKSENEKDHFFSVNDGDGFMDGIEEFKN